MLKGEENQEDFSTYKSFRAFELDILLQEFFFFLALLSTISKSLPTSSLWFHAFVFIEVVCKSKQEGQWNCWWSHSRTGFGPHELPWEPRGVIFVQEESWKKSNWRLKIGVLTRTSVWDPSAGRNFKPRSNFVPILWCPNCPFLFSPTFPCLGLVFYPFSLPQNVLDSSKGQIR